MRGNAWCFPCLVPYGVYPVPLGQFTSVTYPRRKGGKRLDKKRRRRRALRFEIQDVVDSVVNSRKLWFLKNSCGYLRDRLLPTGYEKSPECPVNIDSAPSISSFQLSYRSLQLLAYLNDLEFSK